MKQKLIIEVVCGYMLKVMKSKTVINKFHEEFAAIRHGNYDQFIKLVKCPSPFIVSYKEGQIKTGNFSQKEDFDLACLAAASNSLKLFFKQCSLEYGNIRDYDLPDEIFEEAALFEISLRMHANNNRLLTEREELVNVINKLGTFHKLSSETINDLHLGRKFLNMIKHGKKNNITWEQAKSDFQIANSTLTKLGFTIFKITN